jgi:hypothetical protein
MQLGNELIIFEIFDGMAEDNLILKQDNFPGLL